MLECFASCVEDHGIFVKSANLHKSVDSTRVLLRFCAFICVERQTMSSKTHLLFGSSEIKINRMFTHRSDFLYDAEPQSLLCSVELRALFSAAELVVESRENRSHFGSSSAPAEWRIGALRSPSGAGSPRRRAPSAAASRRRVTATSL